MAQPAEPFTVAELARRTDVKTPLIHYYRRLGLLPEPVPAAPNRFLYNEHHVQALKLIRLLRERRHLSLETIGEVLPALLAHEEQAFRADMWDEVIAAHFEETAPHLPRGRLVAAAREAFSRRGFAEVTVDEICQESGVAKGSFYHHFASKEDVWVAAVESVGEVVEQQLGRRKATVKRVSDAMEPYVSFVLEGVTRALHGEPGPTSAIAKLLDRLSDRCGEKTLEAAFFHLALLKLHLG